MKWISVKEDMPNPLRADKSVSNYVWITDGHVIEIGYFVHRPRNWGCAVHDDEQKATCGPSPHWHPDEEGGPFKEGDKCFGNIEMNEITHWMPLPNPPEPPHD